MTVAAIDKLEKALKSSTRAPIYSHVCHVNSPQKPDALVELGAQKTEVGNMMTPVTRERFDGTE
jgi:hypothetical protein